MKIIGYVMLLAAFALIIFDVTVGTGERKAIWLGRTEKVLRETALPLDHPVANVCHEINRTWASAHHAILVPAIVMLAGAIVLDVAGRGKRKQDQAEPQPPPGN